MLVEDYVKNRFPETGMDYAEVVELYFKEKEPKVEPKDVNNLVNHSPYLKELVKEGVNQFYCTCNITSSSQSPEG